MGTKKPLKDMIPDILKHVEAHVDYLQFNRNIYKMYQGQVREFVEESLKEEIISASAYNRAIQRIPSINIIKKTVDKLGKVYATPPKRLTDNESDKEIMDNIIKGSDFDIIQDTANKMYNLHYGVAVEPFVEKGKIRFRVLGYHQFLPYSDDPVNPLNMTVFIKLLGQRAKIVNVPQYSADGTKLETSEEQIRMVDLFSLYSDDEFMIIDSDGSIRFDMMNEMGVTSTKNPFGVIPVKYYNASKMELIPMPNQAGFDISILIPKLLTDLNHASQYMSHSIIYTKNADIAGQEINPGAVVDLGESSREDGDPEIGIIEPRVQIESNLQLTEFQFSAYMASVGIKTSTVGAMMPGREASGFAKAMDEGDASQERKNQVEVFRHFEAELWELVSVMQTVWGRANAVKENRVFSNEFINTFSIKYPEMKVLKSDQQKLDEIQQMQSIGLMSRTQALRMLFPDFTEKQIAKWEQELDKFEQDKLDNMMKMAPPGPSNENRDDEQSQRKETMGE